MTGSSANYGDELPATGTEGQIFFKIGGVESKVDSFYPVGSIYMSVSSANPGTLFGGTWEQIQNCFLLAAGGSYAAGTTGGEATHTLTIDEMPNHSHSIYGGNNTNPSDWFGGSTNAYGIQNKVGSAYRYLEYVGGDEAHNNMPPYLAVYMWKRIA